VGDEEYFPVTRTIFLEAGTISWESQIIFCILEQFFGRRTKYSGHPHDFWHAQNFARHTIFSDYPLKILRQALSFCVRVQNFRDHIIIFFVANNIFSTWAQNFSNARTIFLGYSKNLLAPQNFLGRAHNF
jgi:hypothetical protein